MADIKKLAERLYDIAQRNRDKDSAVKEFELWLKLYRDRLAVEIMSESAAEPESSLEFRAGDVVTYHEHQAIFVVDFVDTAKMLAKLRLIHGDYSPLGDWDRIARWSELAPVKFTTKSRH